MIVLLQRIFYVSTACVSLVCLSAETLAAPFVLETSTGLFDPGFRGGANTTWFGWGPGSFDGTTNNELIDSPPPTIGTTTSGVNFTQAGVADILAGSNNIYSLFNTETIHVSTPTNGTPSAGFTTIIVQGRANGVGNEPVFQSVDGISPSYVSAVNASGNTQFWAKYDLPGNFANYDVAAYLGNHVSIAELEVDTQWSSLAYSSDLAVVPEPTSAALLAIGGLGLVWRRRRNDRVAAARQAMKSPVIAGVVAAAGLLAIASSASAAPTTSFSEPSTWSVGDENSTSQQWWAVPGNSFSSNLLHTDNPVIVTAPTVAVSSPGFTAGSGGYYSFSNNYKVTATIPNHTDPTALGTHIIVQTAATINPEYDLNPDPLVDDFYDPENNGTGASLFRNGFKILAADGVTVLATAGVGDVQRTLFVEEFASSFGIVPYEELKWEVFLPGFTGNFKVETLSLVHSSFQSLRVDSLVQAVPEPSSLALAGIGAVGMFAARRRRLRNKHSVSQAT